MSDNVFPIRQVPEQAGDPTLDGMFDLAAAMAREHAQATLNPETIFAAPPKVRPEHPLAKKLYRDFRAGSQIMTKTDAYNLGAELDSQLGIIHELQTELAWKLEEARTTVGNLVAEIARLRGEPA